MSVFKGVSGVALLLPTAFALTAHVDADVIDTSLSANYFIITTDGSSSDASDGLSAVSISNFEIGANRAPVPSTDDFLTGGSSGGPTLLGAVPDLPASGIVPVFQGIDGNANVAVTNAADEFDFDDIGVYADPNIGIQIANTSSGSNQSDNSFFNDPNMFPNTFTPTGPTGVGGNLGGTGIFVGPGDADQSTRIDPSNNAGVTFGFDHSALLNELAVARTVINGLASTGTLDVGGGNGGEFDSSTSLSGPASIAQSGNTFTITLDSGLNVIDFDSDDNDILLNNSTLIIDGAADSSVIFRFDSENFLVSNSNILLGDGGIGLNDVLFYTDQDSNDTLFSFSNTILNGAAFWSLGDGGGEINVQNGQGSTQFIADVVSLSDVRFTRWTFGVVPEPTSFVLLGLGGLALLHRRVNR